MAEDAARVLLTKSDAWRYEKKYRIIAFTEDVDEFMNGHRLVAKDGLLKLPPRALRSVIVGCNGDYDGIKAQVSECAPDVKLRRAVRSPAEYRLQILG
jgi:hypothetical protein